MVMHCQECGKKAEENFQFCPFCGKKLIKPKICSNCGAKLKEIFMFCPECGKKWSSSGKSFIPESKKTEKPTPSKKAKSKAASSKMSLKFLKNFKRPGKKVLMIISVICIVLVAAAAVIVFNPFNTNGTSSGGETFTVTVENNYNDAVEYYFIVDGINSYGSPDATYTIDTDDPPMTYNINENDLTIKKNVHEIILHVSIDGFSWETPASALGVTESATFVISDDNGTLSVNCTESQ